MAGVPWPLEFRSHHPWRPDTVTVTWEPCDCPSAKAARGGHVTVRCQNRKCPETWLMPLHKPAPLIEPRSKDNYYR
jgi:hypothetical protein